MSESEWTKILGWPEYWVYRSEINEECKKLRLWVRRKRGNQLRWQRLRPMEKLADMLIDHLDGILNYCR